MSNKDILISDDGVFKVYQMNEEELAKHVRARNGIGKKIRDLMDTMNVNDYIDVPKDRVKETTVRQVVSSYNAKQKTVNGKNATHFSTWRQEDAVRVIRTR